MTTPTPSPKNCSRRFHPAALALGAGLGTAMGVALHNLAIGVALGVACALVFNIAFIKKNA
jgi:hypothetical protein